MTNIYSSNSYFFIFDYAIYNLIDLKIVCDSKIQTLKIRFYK